MSITKQRAKELITKLLNISNNRLKQELVGEHEEHFEANLRHYQELLGRTSWKVAQNWCKWTNDGPILWPDNTRLYYRKGKTEILLLEFEPQTRFLKFKAKLAKGVDSSDNRHGEAVKNYSLALPYMVFIFKFVDGIFNCVHCAFCDRPLRSLDERPLRPYLSNLDTELKVCLGYNSFDTKDLIKDDLTQQTALILDSFWQTIYTDEWSTHYWNSKQNFINNNDKRLMTLEAWENASIDNPLFVIDDVSWLQHKIQDFASMIVNLISHDKSDNQLHQSLYDELCQEFMTDVTKNVKNNIDIATKRTLESVIDELADVLIDHI